MLYINSVDSSVCLATSDAEMEPCCLRPAPNAKQPWSLECDDATDDGDDGDYDDPDCNFRAHAGCSMYYTHLGTASSLAKYMRERLSQGIQKRWNKQATA